MKIQTHYNLGDKAWNIYPDRKSDFVPCLSCDNGKLILKDGKELECPTCKGKGALASRSITVWVPGYRALTIGEVRFSINETETEEAYMCHETGVGSGSVYKLESLYKTADLARAECQKRNNLGEIGWACVQCNPKYSIIQYQGWNNWQTCPIHGHSNHVDIARGDQALQKREEQLAKNEEDGE